MKKKKTSGHAKKKEEEADDREKSYIITQFTEGAEMEEKTILKIDCSLPNIDKYEGEKFSSKIFKMKVDLLNFSGKLDVEAFLEWVKNVESFFEYIETTEDKKVKMIALKLK